jgi:UrcA family protein
MKSLYVLVAAAVAGFGVHTSASADAFVTEPRQQAVNYHDLDLSGAAGAEALYNRIAQAAREACGLSSPWPIDAVAIVKKCRKDATARAVVDVNAPTLTAYYVARHGGTQRLEAAMAAQAQHVASN